MTQFLNPNMKRLTKVVVNGLTTTAATNLKTFTKLIKKNSFRGSVIEPSSVMTTTQIITTTTSTMGIPEGICMAPNLQDTINHIMFLYCFLLGVFYVNFGYRYLRITMFLSGFSISTFAAYFCSTRNQLCIAENIGISICTGFITGSLSMSVDCMGVIISAQKGGVLEGVFITVLYNLLFGKSVPITPTRTSVILFSFGLVNAILNLYIKKGGTIISTSVYGSAKIIMAIDHFCYDSATVQWIFDRVLMEPPVPPPCTFSWTLLALWPIGAIYGMIVQWRVTSKGLDHHKEISMTIPTYKTITQYKNKMTNIPQPKMQNYPSPLFEAVACRNARKEMATYVPTAQCTRGCHLKDVRAGPSNEKVWTVGSEDCGRMQNACVFTLRSNSDSEDDQ